MWPHDYSREPIKVRSFVCPHWFLWSRDPLRQLIRSYVMFFRGHSYEIRRKNTIFQLSHWVRNSRIYEGKPTSFFKVFSGLDENSIGNNTQTHKDISRLNPQGTLPLGSLWKCAAGCSDSSWWRHFSHLCFQSPGHCSHHEGKMAIRWIQTPRGYSLSRLAQAQTSFWLANW